MPEKFGNNNESHGNDNSNIPKRRQPFEIIDTPESGSVFLAEDLARFRSNFQAKIFNENVPAEKWSATASELLEQNPGLRAYESIIFTTVNELYEHYLKVEDLWKKFDGKIMPPEKRNPWYLPLGLEQTDEQTARQLYIYIFGEDYEGEVEVIKGKYTYIFLLPNDQVNKLFNNRGEEDEDFSATGGFALKSARDGLNICVAAKDEGVGAVPHEIEHKRNDILENGRRHALSYLEHTDIPEDIRRIIRRRERKSSPMEKGAKNEILAYCSELVGLETDAEMGKLPPDFDKGKKINELLDSLKSALARDDGWYFKSYVKIYNPSLGEAEKYKQVTLNALSAYETLRTLYKNQYKNSLVDRMVVNILEQFPLHTWPAVARICRTKYDQIHK